MTVNNSQLYIRNIKIKKMNTLVKSLAEKTGLLLPFP